MAPRIKDVEDGPRFARWIGKVGVAKIAAALGVGKYSVYAWRRGAVSLAAGDPVSRNRGTLPAPRHLQPLIVLARGELKAVDIYPNQPPQQEKTA